MTEIIRQAIVDLFVQMRPILEAWLQAFIAFCRGAIDQMTVHYNTVIDQMAARYAALLDEVATRSSKATSSGTTLSRR